MDSQSSAGGGGGGDDEFPVGLRVLVVDDDRTCLRIIDRMLEACRYIVTTCSRAVEALDILRERKGGFDVVLSDVYMPDMDGFKLLEHIGLEMDLPVIMMSADDGKDVVMKGVTHGACDYLIKPVSMKALKNIWQHVIRKKRNELKEMEYSGSMEESDRQTKPSDDGDNVSSVNESGWKNVKRKKEGEEEDESEEREDTSSLKKPRVVWSIELHQQFVAAVNQLGLDKAVPKKILELMNNPVLTRENVASHLQKYRIFLKRITVPQHQRRADTSFSNVPDASSFSSITSLDGFDIQALAASGQIPPQALLTIHPGPRRPTNICMDMSPADQRGFFNSNAQLSNSSMIRPAVVHQVNNNQMSLLYGPSASMELGHIGQVQQNFRSYGNMGIQVNEGTQGFSSLPSSLRTSSSFSSDMMNGHSTNSYVMQMNQHGQQISLGQQKGHIQIGVPRQPHQRGHLFNAREHSARVSATTGQQQMVPNGISNTILVRTGATINGVASLQGNYMNVSPYSSVPQALHPNVQHSRMSGSSCHPQVNNNVAANHTTAGMIHEAIITAPGSLEASDNVTSFKEGKDVIPSYDIYSDVHQNKNQDWKMQNNLSYESTQNIGSKQSNIDYGSSVTTHQDFNGTLKDGVARTTCNVGKEILSIRTEIEHNNVEFGPPDVLFADASSSNELMSVFGKQQDAFGQVEPEFNYELYSFET